MSWVASNFQKSSVRREPIGPEQRLCVTLRYLVTGDAHVTIAASYRISPTSIGRIIKETTGAIWDVLLEKGFLQPPQSSKDWENISRGFENRWNFPHCVGALDGKHVVIQAPAKSGSLFFNYKKNFSIVLHALCDACYQFIAVDIGEAGRKSDVGVFANSNLGRSIVNDYFNLPQPKKLYNESEFLFPYVFVGDDAFPIEALLFFEFGTCIIDF